MTTSSDGRWNGSDHGHQNGLLHPTGSDANSPGSPWFSSLDDEGKRFILHAIWHDSTEAIRQYHEGENASHSARCET